MADNITVLDSTGATVTLRTTDVGGSIEIPMSLPANSAGTAAAFGSGANGATVLPTALATDSPGVVDTFTATATFTPAATSHVANDCVGAAQQFTLTPAPISGSVTMFTDIEIELDSSVAEASVFRLYLYNVTPPSAIADDAQFTLLSGDRASFLGFIDAGTPALLSATSTTCWAEAHGVNKMVKLASTNVFAYLVNLTTVTTTATARVIKLYGTSV